jgi:hypothetical protein
MVQKTFEKVKLAGLVLFDGSRWPGQNALPAGSKLPLTGLEAAASRAL